MDTQIRNNEEEFPIDYENAEDFGTTQPNESIATSSFCIKEEDYKGKRITKEAIVELQRVLATGTAREKEKAKNDFAIMVSPLIMSEVKKKHPATQELIDDLFQSAQLAVWEVFMKYDASKAAPSTYFDYHIKNGLNIAFTQSLGLNGATIKLRSKIIKAINCMLAEGCSETEITPAKIAAYADCSVRVVTDGLRNIELSNPCSLDDSRVVAVEGDSDPVSAVIQGEMKSLIDNAATSLSERDKDIVFALAELDGYDAERKTARKELALKYGLRVNEIEEIYSNGIKVLRNNSPLRKAYYGSDEKRVEKNKREPIPFTFFGHNSSARDYFESSEEIVVIQGSTSETTTQ